MSRAILLGALIAVVVVLGVALFVMEHPSRVGRFTFLRPLAVVMAGVACFAIIGESLAQDEQGGPASPIAVQKAPEAKAPSLAAVLRLVSDSDRIRTIPTNLVPPVAEAVQTPLSNLGFPSVSTGCEPGYSQSAVPPCVFGDSTGVHTMVLYGDSHAGMWFQALDDIATHAHWRLVLLFKPACLAADLPTRFPMISGEWMACDQWHQFAINRIKRIKPDLLIVSQATSYATPSGAAYTPVQWQHGMNELLKDVASPKTSKVVLGDIPGSKGPECLAKYPGNVPKCSTSPSHFPVPFIRAERLAAGANGARYINVTPWFCAKTCSPVIGNYDVYFDPSHVAVGYSRFLEGVLAQKLDLPQPR